MMNIQAKKSHGNPPPQFSSPKAEALHRLWSADRRGWGYLLNSYRESRNLSSLECTKLIMTGSLTSRAKVESSTFRQWINGECTPTRENYLNRLAALFLDPRSHQPLPHYAQMLQSYRATAHETPAMPKLAPHAQDRFTALKTAWTNSNHPTFGRCLVQFRQALEPRVPQTRLAQLLGVSRSCVVNMEAGRSIPPIFPTILAQIAQVRIPETAAELAVETEAEMESLADTAIEDDFRLFSDDEDFTLFSGDEGSNWGDLALEDNLLREITPNPFAEPVPMSEVEPDQSSTKRRRIDTQGLWFNPADITMSAEV